MPKGKNALLAPPADPYTGLPLEEIRSMTKRVFGSLLACSLLIGQALAEDWTPAADVSARQVLNDARRDAQAGRLAEAAQKHFWFHERGLERDPSMVGVRMSFALADWVALARRHPPAMAQLLAVRDRALTGLDAGEWQGQRALSEAISINNYLGGQHESTRDAFARFADRDPVLAESELMDALPALVALNEFDLASRHLRVDSLMPRLEMAHRSLIDASIGRMSENQRQAMLRNLQRGTDLKLARLVLVLAKTGRHADAEQVIARGRALLGEDASLHHMTAALAGRTPPLDEWR
jgi:hypothetical protein